ncbi:hypothetical protein H4219_005584, partial [Mycoemilia scoparia]
MIKINDMIKQVGIYDLTAVQTFVKYLLPSFRSTEQQQALLTVEQGKQVVANLILLHNACVFLAISYLVKVGINPNIDYAQGLYTDSLMDAKRLFEPLKEAYNRISSEIMVD